MEIYKSRNYKPENVAYVYIKFANRVIGECSQGYSLVVDEVNAEHKTIRSYETTSEDPMLNKIQVDAAFELRNQTFNAVRIK